MSATTTGRIARKAYCTSGSSLNCWKTVARMRMMMNEGLFYPNLNLRDIDPQCAPLRYLTKPQEIKTDYVMNNNFAFGGVNTSLIFKKN